MKFSSVVHSPVDIESRRSLSLRAGDTVRVHQRVPEKDRIRIQVFEGLVIARKHGKESGATFTVRRINDAFGVEKVFPLYSPMIDKIEIVRRAKVRHSKLYFVREKSPKVIRQKLRRSENINEATSSEEEIKKNAAQKAKQEEEAKAKQEAAEAEAAKQKEEEVKKAEAEAEAKTEEQKVEQSTEVKQETKEEVKQEEKEEVKQEENK
ncbi:MAG: 50S ribosomal protein L19 [Candidatus Campbellbacteria bacterium]|nr:50S ribosomal protein L19 [Candidatus Campbellbacteria bacterium]